MRQTSAQFMDAMLSESAQRPAESRLDRVSEMVANMEKNLSEKIEQANKEVVDKLTTKVTDEVSNATQGEPTNIIDDGGLSNENNSGSSEQSEE